MLQELSHQAEGWTSGLSSVTLGVGSWSAGNWESEDGAEQLPGGNRGEVEPADRSSCRGRGEEFWGGGFSGPWGMTGHIFKVRWRGIGPRLAETSKAPSSGEDACSHPV